MRRFQSEGFVAPTPSQLDIFPDTPRGDMRLRVVIGVALLATTVCALFAIEMQSEPDTSPVPHEIEGSVD